MNTLSCDERQRGGRCQRPASGGRPGAGTHVRGTEGKLDLGPWEQVFYAEVDGQRRKRVVVKVIGE